MDEQERIEAVQEYASEHPDFDATFIDSLEEFFGRKGYLTEGQSDALDRIIESFRIVV